MGVDWESYRKNWSVTLRYQVWVILIGLVVIHFLNRDTKYTRFDVTKMVTDSQTITLMIVHTFCKLKLVAYTILFTVWITPFEFVSRKKVKSVSKSADCIMWFYKYTIDQFRKLYYFLNICTPRYIVCTCVNFQISMIFSLIVLNIV